MEVIRKLHLTGIHAGKTKVFRGIQFLDGTARVKTTEKDFLGLARFLNRMWGIVTEEEFQEHGELQVDPSGQAPSGEGDGQPSPVDDLDGPEGSGPRTSASEQWTSDAEGSPGDPGLEPDGDGPPGPSPAVSDAVSVLDEADDEHWTADGRPRVDVVSELVGAPVTRGEIELTGARRSDGQEEAQTL